MVSRRSVLLRYSTLTTSPFVGTEIEPSAGEALLAEFWRDDDPDLATTTKDPVPSDSTSPPSLHIITASGLVGGA